MAILVFHHSDQAGVERLGETLRDYGHRLDILHLHESDSVPADLDGVDGIITCGGPLPPDDDSPPWLGAQMDRLREAHARKMPVVGICFGSQILARALGGSVAKMDSIEFGWIDVELSDVGREDPVHAGVGWTTKQFSHHRYHVTELPAGATLLASSDQCNVQAWRSDLRTYGFQYHPEIHRETIDVWLEDDPGLLKESGVTREQLDKQTNEFFGHYERTTHRLFESIALFLMPVDRRYAGIAKDLHH